MRTGLKHESILELGGKHAYPCFNVAVVFTDVQNTLESLRVADRLAAELSTCITLLVAESDKHPASTISSITLADFTSRYFMTMLSHTPKLQMRITRYPVTTCDLWEVLPPHSIIIMSGATHRFWPSVEQRFARQLRHAGHEVILLSTGSHSSL